MGIGDGGRYGKVELGGNMIYGYARVSSKGQARDGNSLEAQEEALREAGAQVIYQEAFTGTTTDRPEFDKVKSLLKEGDTLVVTKLDRFARTASEGDKVIGELMNKGVTIKILNMGTLDNTAIGKMIRMMFLAFAEFERNTIMERMNEGKRIKKANGGRTEGRLPAMSDLSRFKELLGLQQKGEISVVNACKELGISKATWYNYAKSV